MANLCEGRVVLVTGAGRGIGRSEALAFAREGAQVVVSDIGVELDGSGGSTDVASLVVAEIKDLGGEAVAAVEDIGDTDGAARAAQAAVDNFGRLDVIVNNAGILRDKMIFNMEPEDFDAVIRVHLRGTWNLLRWGAIYWRERSKEGEGNDARVINTSSPAGLYGNVGQTNYSPAKAGIAAMTITAARELNRYGVNVNAISPVARTRMTQSIPRSPDRPAPSAAAEEQRDPDYVAPLVVWLGSRESAAVTGQVFEVGAGSIGVAEGWRHGPNERRGEGEGNWEPSELGPLVANLLERADASPRI